MRSGVNNTTSTDDQRQAVIDEINQALQSLVNAGNAKLKGQYLFAGSTSSSQPFDFQGDFVAYSGNEQNLRNFVDTEFLFSTNVPGSDVFGGLSSAVRGAVDLNPQLTSDTALSTINGGQGISSNAAISVTVNNGTAPRRASSISAARPQSATSPGLIESHPPAGSTLTVEIVNNGLSITTDSGSTVKVGEVATAKTAHELGIFTPTYRDRDANGARLRFGSGRAQDDAPLEHSWHKGPGAYRFGWPQQRSGAHRDAKRHDAQRRQRELCRRRHCRERIGQLRQQHQHDHRPDSERRIDRQSGCRGDQQQPR